MSWAPASHVNCLIGPGDAGKTTVLDAIELALALRHQVAFDDSDFYGAKPENSILITVTLGELPPTFKSTAGYGEHTRGWDAKKQEIVDEPDEGSGLETVLSTRLTVDRTLEPKWTIYSDRNADDPKKDRKFKFEDRLMMAPTRLGVYTDRHLGWGRQSILGRMSEKGRSETELLAESIRAARQQFVASGKRLFESVVTQVGTLARRVGVKLGTDLSARLDVQGISVNSGGISLHDGELPLRLLGAGSSRLLVAALQNQAGEAAPFALIDEVEHGLEPHRISRLLRYLKSPSSGSPPQLFLTTHSPIVLQELAINDLAVVRRNQANGKVTVIAPESDVPSVDSQGQLRAHPNPYLSRSVLVCEGKTEAGLARGLDHYWADHNHSPFATLGIAPLGANGKDEAPKLAKHFCKLLYRVAVFLDSDQDPDDRTALPELKRLGVQVIRWEKGKATEDVLFGDLSDGAVKELVDLLKTEKYLASIPEQINSLVESRLVKDWDDLTNSCTQPAMRGHLAACAKKHCWIKSRLALSESIGARVLGPHLSELSRVNAASIEQLRTWIDGD